MLIGNQFYMNLYVQLGVLSVILFNFDFVCLSIVENLVLLVTLFLSDLAVAANRSKMDWIERKKVLFEKPKTVFENFSVSKQFSASPSGTPR